MKRPTREPDTKRIMKLLEELESGAKYVERFAIKSGEKVVFIRAEDVDSIEAEGNYVRLNLANASSHLLRDTINNVESQIDPRTFVRIHRSTIVNMNRVKEHGAKVSTASCYIAAPAIRLAAAIASTSTASSKRAND